MRERAIGADERFERTLAVQALFTHVARRIGPALELEPVLHEAMTAMRSLVEFRGGTIGLVDDRGVYVAAADPPVSPDVAEARVPVGTGLAGRCVGTGQPVYSPDVIGDERVDQRLRNTGTNRPMRSYLAVPLICLGEVIGVLQVDSSDVDAFDADDLRVLEGLAAQVAGAIESARQHEAVRRLDDARSMFVARVSHELRTPLTIMLGLTSALISNPEHFHLTPELVDILGRIDQAGARLHALVEELITMGTLETGMLLEAQPAEVQLLGVLEAVRAEATSPEDVQVACSPHLHAKVDPVLLRQALHLLVQNALIYAGAAALEAVDGDTGRVEVRVVDHGPGISDDRKAQVFERFNRGEHSGPGWGLGLSVVARLTSAMGSEIRLTDTPGGGATFTLVLSKLSRLL